MKEGDVVLTPIPQADGVIKNRPAIVLRTMPPYRDFLVCGVSTQLDKEAYVATNSRRSTNTIVKV
jgi:mRNA interferase MazF